MQNKTIQSYLPDQMDKAYFQFKRVPNTYAKALGGLEIENSYVSCITLPAEDKHQNF